jgi:hypothetical protein
VAFDVYVGTMTRFYSREWENVVQRMAREQGTQYKMVFAGEEPEPPPAADHIREAVANWCEALSIGLQPHGLGPCTWDEDDSMPYFTDRPSWEGYAALLVWAAHSEHPDLPIPAGVPRSWADDPAYQRSTVRKFKSRYETLLEPELWLPTTFPFIFEAPTLVSEKGRIGSVFTLKEQLDELHQQTSAKLKERKQAEHEERPAPKKPGVIARLLRGRSPHLEAKEPALVEAAIFGLSIFRDLASKACEHRLPMLLHF